MPKYDKSSRLQKRVEKLAEMYKHNPIVETYSPRLAEMPCPAPAWSKFYRLQDAIARTHKDHPGQLRVFAVEAKTGTSSGKREFVVASYKEFWYYYTKMKKEDRHFYEVIEEGAACHLYFDLEFSKIENPDLNGENLLLQFLEYVCKEVGDNFGIKITEKNILDLDSTNEKKFSRHLIIHLPNAAFRCNYDVGAFVVKICADSGSKFLVKMAGDKMCSFVDTGVYSKSRNFRLFLSSKKSKNTFLTRSSSCCFDFALEDVKAACCIHHIIGSYKIPEKRKKITEDNLDELIFYASLITNIVYHDNLRILTFEKPGCVPKYAKQISISGGNVPEVSTVSPFPDLQDFVLSFVKTVETRGFISKWVYFPCNRSIIFNISGNRYCGNIGRQHKSNHIYYVADLAKKHCYQKCYDPVCKADMYRSPPIDFPEYVSDSIFDDIDDLELVNHVEMVETLQRSQSDGESENDWGDAADKDVLGAINKME